MKQFSSFITEARKQNLTVAAGAGRFTGVTKEHEKLINNVLGQKADHHYVFVMGPSSVEQTTEKDPFTVQEKIDHLKKLYPEHADSFIAGDQPHTKTPNQSLAWLYHRHKDDAKNVHLTMVGGSGNAGVKGKNVGGSIEQYGDIIDRYNGSRFPEKVDEMGNKTGGDYRFKFGKVNLVPNERGTISGSVVRQAARTLDPNDPKQVAQFKEMLHSKTDNETAKTMMILMRERANRAESINKLKTTLKQKK